MRGQALLSCKPCQHHLCVLTSTATFKQMHYSLQGLAGAVCFWLDTLDPQHAAFPGYEL
jgi:hypothetical protein